MSRLLIAVIPFVLTACGPDAAAYQQQVSALEVAVTQHQDESQTTADCVDEHRRYDELARPRLGQMTGMSGPMGMRSMCGSMQSELDRHAGAACAGDAAANRAEAVHHCQLMKDWLGRQQTCTRSMMGMGGRCEP
ncbi:MAG: hypothetical protein Q8L48_08780 [Archangium sp.]|nr:hypothetical protein [Archangium sp.]